MQLEFAFDAPATHPQSAERPDVPTSQQVQARRRRVGASNHHGGRAAEEQVLRHYLAHGADLLAERCRTPGGELDLVLDVDGIVVFVEVKRRGRASPWDQPVSNAQWRRLELAAIHYILERQTKTGVQSFCRFDVALVGPDGSLRIVENARSFDT